MKFSLFAHMERISSEQTQDKLYEEFIATCKMADQGGMRAIWTGEHHGMDFTIAPNPFISITDLSHQVKNVRLGTGTVVAPFWHPIKLAGESAMTDLVTGGRLELGLARGAYSYEYERLMPGMDAMEAGARLRETVPTLRKLWQGDYAHNGEFYQFPSTTSAPKPLQESGPPLWIAARDPNSHEFAVANDCNVQVTPLWNGISEIEDLMQKFNAAKEKVGSGKKPKIMLLQHCYVSNSSTELEQASKDLSRFYCYFGSWFQNKRNVSQGLLDPLSDTEMEQMTLYTPEVIRENMAMGTVQEVIDRIKRYEDLGYDEFSYWIDSGMSGEQKTASLDRFIDQVMPAFS